MLEVQVLSVELPGRSLRIFKIVVLISLLIEFALCWSLNGPEPGGPESTIIKREKEADSACWSFNGPEPGGSESEREEEAAVPWFTRKPIEPCS